MAAYFNGGGGADSGLQTLYLMKPNYVGYSDAVPAAAAAPNMMLFNSPAASFGHHQPPQQHLVGIPLQPPPHSSSAVSAVLSLSSREEAPPPATVQQDEQVLMSSSRYLKAAQELLDEAVSVEEAMPPEVKKKMMKKKEEEDGGGGSKAEMSTAERQELHMKKNKLVNMLDEVEHRYRRYHLEMQAASSSFDAAAGRGSARSYTALALGTISRRFRCLRDAIAAQVRSASLILGEDTDGGGRTVGSRLRLIDHRLRQQLGMARGGGAWRTQRGLPERSVSVLRAWLFEHFLHPYPKDSDKVMLAKQTGLTRSQVSNWFVNARVRLWKPMVEEMYLEETGNTEAAGAGEEEEDGGNNRELSAAAVSIVDADPQQQVQPSFYGEDDAAATSFQQQQLKKARTKTRAAHDEPAAAFVHVSGAGHRELLMKFMEAGGGGEDDGRGQGHHQASAGGAQARREEKRRLGETERD